MANKIIDYTLNSYIFLLIVVITLSTVTHYMFNGDIESEDWEKYLVLGFLIFFSLGLLIKLGFNIRRIYSNIMGRDIVYTRTALIFCLFVLILGLLNLIPYDFILTITSVSLMFLIIYSNIKTRGFFDFFIVLFGGKDWSALNKKTEKRNKKIRESNKNLPPEDQEKLHQYDIDHPFQVGQLSKNVGVFAENRGGYSGVAQEMGDAVLDVGKRALETTSELANDTGESIYNTAEGAYFNLSGQRQEAEEYLKDTGPLAAASILVNARSGNNEQESYDYSGNQYKSDWDTEKWGNPDYTFDQPQYAVGSEYAIPFQTSTNDDPGFELGF